MGVSVITVCFNSILSIEDTIRSVLSQGDIIEQYILIDGGSTDGTLHVIKRYNESHNKIKLLSEPDNGIYDAINKGLRLASSEWVTLLHSDDTYYSPNTLVECIKCAPNDVNTIYGNLKIFKGKKIYRTWHAGKFELRKLLLGWMPPHTTLIVKKKLLQAIGPYDTEYTISSDFDYCQRLFRSKDCKPFFCNRYVIRMSAGGVSTKNLKSEYIKLLEDWKIMKKFKINRFNGLIYKKLTKVVQLLK